jgi:RNA ligase (TIGR02306 family)
MSSLIVEVCKVEDIIKHPNADRLSIVRVKGWNCIVGLDQYKIGDLVVFVPPDCIIPPNLIEKYNLEYLRHDGRTRNVKLRGSISQGLILDLPEEKKWRLGDDASNFLGITKWEPPEPKYYVPIKKSSRKRINPNFDKYTEMEDIKNYPDVFNENDNVVITEKIHGCNARYGNLQIVISKNQPLLDRITLWIKKNIFDQDYEFVYGSHQVQITFHSNRRSFYGKDYWGEIAKKYDFANNIPKGYIVYGEIYGEKVQDLTYGLKGRDIVIFDIKKDGQYMNWNDVIFFCAKRDWKTVPELYIGKFNRTILKRYTDGNSILCPSQLREGCVVKCFPEENDIKIGRKILKSRSEAYLLRKGGTEYQ